MNKNEIEKLLIKKHSNKASEVNKIFIDDIVAFKRKDPNHSFQTKNIYFDLAKELLSKNVKIDELSSLTFEQEEIFKLIEENVSIAISAQTSFGKTWLIREAFLKKVQTILSLESGLQHVASRSSTKINFVHIVPNEILVSDISTKLARKVVNKNLDGKINVGFPMDLGKSNYLVGTPEKIYPELARLDSISYIVADEAHEMFYQNERSKYYKTTFEFACERFSETPIIMCGAFLGKDSLNSLNLNREMSFKNPIGFRSLYCFKNNEEFILKNERVDSFNNDKRTTLHYFPTTDSCISAFEDEVWKSKVNPVQIINNILDNTEDFEKNQLILSLMAKYHINKNETEVNRRYNVIDGLVSGVGLYHANMPKDIKMLVYQFAEKGYLRKIFATTAITGGLDIFVDNIIFDSLKVNRHEMDETTFFNIAGRAGRYSPGRSQAIGIVDLNTDKNFENRNWVANNYKTLFERKYSLKSILEDQDDYNITQTLLELQKFEKNSLEYKALLIDPRIHPSVSLWFLKNKNETTSLLIDLSDVFEAIFKEDKRIIYEEKVWKRVDLIKQKLQKLLEKYTNDKVKFKSRAFLHNMEEKHIKIIRYFFKYILFRSENRLFNDFGIYLSKPDAHTTYSEGMKELSELFYKEVKYALYSYINHFLKICKLLNLTDVDLDAVMEEIDKNEKMI